MAYQTNLKMKLNPNLNKGRSRFKIFDHCFAPSFVLIIHPHLGCLRSLNVYEYCHCDVTEECTFNWQRRNQKSWTPIRTDNWRRNSDNGFVTKRHYYMNKHTEGCCQIFTFFDHKNWHKMWIYRDHVDRTKSPE